MDTQKHDERAYKEPPTRTISKRCFRRDHLGQSWGLPSNMIPPRQGGPCYRGGDRLNPNGQIFDDEGNTNKAVY